MYRYILQVVLLSFFFVIYCRGGGLSQQLQEQPYFTQDRTNPRNAINLHQNTVERNPQPAAVAHFVDTPVAPYTHVHAHGGLVLDQGEAHAPPAHGGEGFSGGGGMGADGDVPVAVAVASPGAQRTRGAGARASRASSGALQTSRASANSLDRML